MRCWRYCFHTSSLRESCSSMNCPACGAEVVTGAEFCHRCGAQLAPSIPLNQQAPTAAARVAQAVSAAPAGADVEQVLWQGRFSKLAMIGAWTGATVVTA